MGQGSGIREVSWIDIAGGGQVVLDGDYAYAAAKHQAGRRRTMLSGDDQHSRGVNRRIFLRRNGRVATSIATAERLRVSLPSEPGRLVDLIT